MTGDEALKRLMEGNRRFAADAAVHPHQTAERRAELLAGQDPFAIVLTCSDSRVTPEILFDQGLGDLFVICVAGNVLDDLVMGSIEYAAAHLKTPLLMVLGHTSCGAVTAAVSGEALEGHLTAIGDALKPAVDQTGAQAADDPVACCVEVNAKLTAAALAASQPLLADLVEAGSLKVVAACYDLESGRVTVY